MVRIVDIKETKTGTCFICNRLPAIARVTAKLDMDLEMDLDMDLEADDVVTLNVVVCRECNNQACLNTFWAKSCSPSEVKNAN